MAVTPVINIILDNRKGDPAGIVCCAGYEQGKWRKVRLAKHLLDWLPDYVFTQEEKDAIDPIRPYKTLERAARRFFKPMVPSERGELGELLIHILCIQEFKTRQFVARLFYKMRTNDQVTGFDIVHVRHDSKTDNLELWLGEAKIHKSFSDALTKAIKTLSDHLDNGFLSEAKSLIGPKIPSTDPLYDRLSWLFDDNVSLDELVHRLVVPVFVAANCKPDGTIGDLPSDYDDQAKLCLSKMQKRLLDKYGKELEIVSIYMPLNDKDSLSTEFESRLTAFT